MKIYIKIFLFVFIFLTSCVNLSYRAIENNGMRFTYDFDDGTVPQQINEIMTQKCGGSDKFYIQGTERKEEHRTYNYTYTSYETSKFEGTSNYGSSYSGTISTPKTEVVPIRSTSTYYVTKAFCLPEFDYEKLYSPNEKTNLLPLELQSAINYLRSCENTSKEVEDRKLACLQTIPLVENNYKDINDIPIVELIILVRVSTTFCMLEPESCYLVKRYAKLKDMLK